MLASNVAEAIAFTPSPGAGDATPDIELVFAPVVWRKQGLEPPQLDAFTNGVAANDRTPTMRRRQAVRDRVRCDRRR